jgi:hypothetical protein
MEEKFITIFTTARHWYLSWTICIRSTTSHSSSLRSFIILSSHLCLVLSCCLFPYSQPLVPILSNMHVVHIFPLYFPKIHSNIILPSMPSSFAWPLLLYPFLNFHIRATCPSHVILLDLSTFSSRFLFLFWVSVWLQYGAHVLHRKDMFQDFITACC